MKAVVFDSVLSFPRDYAVPRRTGNEALIRVRMAGICNTDREITRGYGNFSGIIGHEFVGVVEEAPPDSSGWIGKRVVGEINCGCEECAFCGSGLAGHCPDRTVLGIHGRGGAMAELVTLPVQNLHEVPGTVADEEAVFVEPLAAAYRIPQQVAIGERDSILVLGDGKLGLLTALVLQKLAAHVTLGGKHATKLAVAQAQNVEAVHVGSLPPRRLFDVVVDATGSAAGLGMAIRFARPCGTVVLKSTVAGDFPMNLSPVVINEIRVIGSRCGPFGPAIEALKTGSIDVRPLITGIFTFERAAEAFETALRRESLKVILRFD